MPALIAFLWGMFLSILPSIVGRVLIALGVSFVTYTGVNVVVSAIKTNLLSNMSGLPAMTYQFLAWMNVGVAVNMIFSAIAASMAIKGLTGAAAGAKMVIKPKV